MTVFNFKYFRQTKEILGRMWEPNRECTRPMFQELHKMSSYHKDTHAHMVRVGFMAVDLGIEVELSDQNLLTLGYAGVLHDVGKTKVPLEILNKPTSLSELERKVMMEHPVNSYHMLMDFPNKDVKYIVLAHHEYQEDGYRRKFKNGNEAIGHRHYNQDVCIMTQLVSAADIIDALIRPRSYKPGLPLTDVNRLFTEKYTGTEKFKYMVTNRLLNTR